MNSASFVDPAILKRLLVNWIANNHLSFATIESPELIALLRYLNNGLDTHDLLPSSQTLQTWIIQEYAQRKERIKKELRVVKQKIHISFDLLTSPNSLGLMGIIGYWTKESQVQFAMLRLSEIEGSHTGEHLSQQLYNICQNYDITNRIGYFMMDSATNNDTCIQSYYRQLCFPTTPSADSVNQYYNKYRLRCFGHIINLTVKAMLFGDAATTFEMEDCLLEVSEDPKDYLLRIENWRKKGPIGRLHNIVRYIRATSKRRQDFLTIQTGGSTISCTNIQQAVNEEALMVVQDNATRWNSTQMMIDRAILLQDYIETYCNRQKRLPKSERPKIRIDEDILSEEDWAELRQIQALLEPFKAASVALQGRGRLNNCNRRNGLLFEVLPEIDNLLDTLEILRTQYEGSVVFSPYVPMLKLAWEKLNYYYGLTDRSSVYIDAVVLNPFLKWIFFETKWHDQKE